MRLDLAIMVAATLACSTIALAQKPTTYHGRRAWTLANDKIEVVVTPGGGHIASLTLKSGRGAGLNPLWLPPWKSVEPRQWNRTPGAYGDPPGSPLLASILGHNICLDFFGSPSDEEAKAGIPVHGEAPVADWKLLSSGPSRMSYGASLPNANMEVVREIALARGSSAVWINETVKNLSALDRPIGWQQHVTLCPPFLETGASLFDLDATWSTVDPREFSKGQRLQQGGEFEWPNAPGADGQTIDLREWPKDSRHSSDFTVSLIDPAQKWGWFTAINPKRGLLIGYIWPRADWPWAANWEENHFRSAAPWHGKAVTRGIEFGTSPFAYSRRDTVTMGKLHDVPTYRWLPAKAKQTVGYAAFLAPIPPGTTGVTSVELEGKRIAIHLAGADQVIQLAVARR